MCCTSRIMPNLIFCYKKHNLFQQSSYVSSSFCHIYRYVNYKNIIPTESIRSDLCFEFSSQTLRTSTFVTAHKNKSKIIGHALHMYNTKCAICVGYNLHMYDHDDTIWTFSKHNPRTSRLPTVDWMKHKLHQLTLSLSLSSSYMPVAICFEKKLRTE